MFELKPPTKRVQKLRDMYRNTVPSIDAERSAIITDYYKKSRNVQPSVKLQVNVVSAETLRKAQANPDDYRDLVVRVAGFSAYFIELYKGLQGDIIHRTDNIF